jgi:indolepyruvate ferredoxin oxidoreductase
VTVEGGELVKGLQIAKLPGETTIFPVLPEPELPALDRPWSILVTGIGGTGVVTVGHILGMAAHLEGKGSGIIDMAGLSQKNGAVVTHLKLARRPEDIATIRIAAGGADLILGCDLVTSASERVLATASRSRTSAIVNAHQTMPAQFTGNPDFKIPADEMRLQIEARTRADGATFIDSSTIATALLGDSIAANLFTLGFAWQKGLVPLSAAAIEQAIELNGVSVKMNLQAFLWGRRAAHDRSAVEAVIAAAAGPEPETRPETLPEMVERRVAFLKAYQSGRYARAYKAFVDKVIAAETTLDPSSEILSKAVARYLFKLMAYKDEYEVARLYTDGTFAAELARKFKGPYRLSFHLAPPLLANRDPATGHLRKQAFGPWMMTAFKLLARFRRLRGTPLDIFGYSEERRKERALIGEYRRRIDELLAGLTTRNLPLATEIAAIPERIRGYGHVKDRHLEEAEEQQAALLARWRAGDADTAPRIAAE